MCALGKQCSLNSFPCWHASGRKGRLCNRRLSANVSFSKHLLPKPLCNAHLGMKRKKSVSEYYMVWNTAYREKWPQSTGHPACLANWERHSCREMLCSSHALMDILVSSSFSFFFKANQSFADPSDLTDPVGERLAEFKPNAEGHGGETKTRMPKFKEPSWKSAARSWKVDFALFWIQTFFFLLYKVYFFDDWNIECFCGSFSFYEMNFYS